MSRLACAGTLVIAAALVGHGAFGQETGPFPTPGPDELAFSLENMDEGVAPEDDFLRYAAGAWFDRVSLPADRPAINYLDILSDRVNAQAGVLVRQAAADIDEAARGSPTRQIGTLYIAYMDAEAINAAGMAPLQAELDRLAAVGDRSELAAYLGRYTTITSSWPFFEIDVFEDLNDSNRAAVYVQSGTRVLPIGAIYESSPGSPLRQIYLDYASGMLEIAGYSQADAARIAADALAIDTRLHAAELNPVLKVDLRNLNNPLSLAELRTAAPSLDVDTYFNALGLERPEGVIVTDPDYPAAVSGVIDEFTLDQIKGYLALRLVRSFAPVLSSDFERPVEQASIALLGAYPQETRHQKAVKLVEGALGQPVGRLYTEAHFPRANQAKALEMVHRIQAAFRRRVQANDWMDETTRAEALAKVDGLYYRVGYPDKWIDFSPVGMTGDLVEDLSNINRFRIARKMDRMGRPVERWAFSDPGHTLPINVNAAYNPSINGFEVTSAIAQPPVFQPELDAPIYFCRLGAVIGHEMTHGFDTGGRTMDAAGTMRNWWTLADEAHFTDETQKLVEQADAFEVLPDTYINGGLTVKENLADIGGITLAFDALQQYLADNPEEDVLRDGLTPSQRCFISWAQMWAEQRSEQAMRAQLEDNHAPGIYRAVAPLQHVDAFYDAFGIEKGDAMWLAPDERVNIW